MTDEVKVVTVPVVGAFEESLKRNNKKIRDDRATSIVEDTKVLYRRAVEDLVLAISKMKRERDGMLDLSPTDANSLMLASDFDAPGYVTRDLDLGVKIRTAEIKLEIAQSQYKHLFGGE